MAIDNTRYDLQLVDNDLFISVAGDFVIGPSDEQHIQDAIIAGPSWWKENPTNGANFGIYENGPTDKQFLEKLLRINLNADGYTASPTLINDPEKGLIVYPNATI